MTGYSGERDPHEPGFGPVPYEPDGHYWSKNIYAVREWAIGLMKYDARHGIKTPEGVFNVEDWCRVWIENDPFDNGGDASVRRDMRAEWREVFATYKRLRGV